MSFDQFTKLVREQKHYRDLASLPGWTYFNPPQGAALADECLRGDAGNRVRPEGPAWTRDGYLCFQDVWGGTYVSPFAKE